LEGEENKTLSKLKYCPPGFIKNLYSDFEWVTKDRRILLTFDDGPNPSTSNIILKTLNDNNIKSLFFCVGENISKYPEIAKDIIAEGHSIGNHTFTHKKITKLDEHEIIKEIKDFNNIYKNLFDSVPRYFRPPHGRFKNGLHKILGSLELTNVMWSLLTYDYKNDLNIVKFAVQNYLKQNSIIVLHDNIKCKDIIEDSIKFIIEHAKSRDFKFGTPESCLR
jgi:peptidoglycan/xylan/chitin deacetylase (PgdA/CDA1 family)